MQGTYLLLITTFACLLVWPNETISVITSVSLKIQVYYLNWRMKRQALKIHKRLARDMKEHFGSDMPEFKWVDLWERDR